MENKTDAPIGIEKLRADLARWLSIPPEDRDVIDFALGVYKSHEIPGDPLWGIIIDASGAGKTELLRAFRSQPDAYFLSNLTENTLVSGYRDPKAPDKDPSLLPELAHVARDRTGAVQYLPRPEVGTRLGKELGKLLLALALVRGNPEPDEMDFGTVVRVAEDCVPPNRMTVLNVLRLAGASVTPSDIEKGTGLPHSTAMRTLEDLELLGLAECHYFGELDLGRTWKLLADWKAAS